MQLKVLLLPLTAIVLSSLKIHAQGFNFNYDYGISMNFSDAEGRQTTGSLSGGGLGFYSYLYGLQLGIKVSVYNSKVSFPGDTRKKIMATPVFAEIAYMPDRVKPDRFSLLPYFSIGGGYVGLTGGYFKGRMADTDVSNGWGAEGGGGVFLGRTHYKNSGSGSMIYGFFLEAMYTQWATVYKKLSPANSDTKGKIDVQGVLARVGFRISM
jgi:hypothetical protein